MIKKLICLLLLLHLAFALMAQDGLQVISGPQVYTKGIKVDLFGLFRGYSQISYEKVTSLGRSYEFSLGIIGVGKHPAFDYSDTVIGSKEHYKDQFGFFLSAGYKFNKLPLLEIGKKYGTNIFQGLYAKPIIYIGKYDENRIAIVKSRPNVYELQRPSTTFGALQVEIGKEWVVANKALIDGYIGIGYGFDNKKYYSTSYYSANTTSAFNYCNGRIGSSPGISYTVGIKTGLLLK